MRIASIRDVLGMPAGVAFEGVAGVVTGMTEYKTGENKYGPWSIQNVTITDGPNKVKVKVVNHPEMTREWMNSKVTFLAGAGQKGQPVGLKTDIDTYKGVSSVIVALNENGRIDGSYPETSTPPQPQAGTPAPRPNIQPQADPLPGNEEVPMDFDQAAPAAPSRPVATPPAAPTGPLDPKRAWAKADKFLLRLVRCRVRCEQARDSVVRQLEAMGIHTSADHAEKIASWLAIEATRGGLLADIPDCDPPQKDGHTY